MTDRETELKTILEQAIRALDYARADHAPTRKELTEVRNARTALMRYQQRWIAAMIAEQWLVHRANMKPLDKPIICADERTAKNVARQMNLAESCGKILGKIS